MVATIMSFLSNEEKGDLDSVLDILHDTFSKTLYAHIDGEITVVSYDSSYNSMYGSPSIGSTPEVTVEPSRVAFKGRILFDEKQTQRDVDVGDESSLKLRFQDGNIRLKVDAEGKDIIKDAKKIEIEGELYEFETKGRPHGLFANNYSTFYLRRLN